MHLIPSITTLPEFKEATGRFRLDYFKVKSANLSNVTNITLLGFAMVNWSIGLLDPGDDNSYHGVSLVHALGLYSLELTMCQWSSVKLLGSAAMCSLSVPLGGLLA